jgi:hypothetical protein
LIKITRLYFQERKKNQVAGQIADSTPVLRIFLTSDSWIPFFYEVQRFGLSRKEKKTGDSSYIEVQYISPMLQKKTGDSSYIEVQYISPMLQICKGYKGT